MGHGGVLRGGPGRFNDETFGALYAAREGYTLFGARVLLADITASPADIRGRSTSLPEPYDPDPARYGPAQRWAASQRTAGADGIVYDSVRRVGGQCVALFRPRLVTTCRVGDRIAYEWDGAEFVAMHTLSPRE